MKTYRNPGVAVDWAATGNAQEVTRLETFYGVGDASQLALPVRLSMRGETTKRGIRRVVARAEMSLPGTVLNDMYGSTVIDPKTGSVPVSVHLVAQAPQLAVMREVGNSASNYDDISSFVTKMLRDLIAITTNTSIDADTTLSVVPHEYPVVKALAGAAPLDVVNGAYGKPPANNG